MVISVLSVVKTKVHFAALHKVVLNCFQNSSSDVVVFNSSDKVSHICHSPSFSVKHFENFHGLRLKILVHVLSCSAVLLQIFFMMVNP